MAGLPHLPPELAYLQPVVDRLVELPDDEINEDLDTSFIDEAVRGRFANSDQASAEEEFEEHYRLFNSLCEELADKRGVLAYLEGYLGIFVYEPEFLTKRPEPPPNSDNRVVLAGAPPFGVTIEQPCETQLILRRGEICIVIMAQDEFGFRMLTINRDNWSMPKESPCVFDRRVENVQFGPVHGTRDLYEQTAPVSWKQVSYLLTVPGGQVDVRAFAGSKENNEFGKDFSTADVEAILPLICVVPED